MIQSPDGTCICDECILYCTDVLAVAAILTAAIPARAICLIRSTATSTVTKAHCAGPV